MGGSQGWSRIPQSTVGTVEDRPGYHGHGGGLPRTDQDTTIGRLRPREQIQFHLRDQEQGISSIPGTSNQKEDHFGGEENISEQADAAIFSSRLVGGDVMCQPLWTWTLHRSSGGPAASAKIHQKSPIFLGDFPVTRRSQKAHFY